MPFKVIQGHRYWCQSKFEGGLTIVHEDEDLLNSVATCKIIIITLQDRVRFFVALCLYVYLVPFTRQSELFIESRQFYLPHLHLAPPLGVTPFEFHDDLWRRKTKTPWAIMWRCFCYPTLSHFDTIGLPACDGRKDGQTNTGP